MSIEISKQLPKAELTHLNLGYMRLSDSAPLIVAQELGFYEQLGLTVTLHREVSWANIRDKTIAGTFDACQMLSPMPLVTTLGAAGIRVPMLTGLILSKNGNAITVSKTLWNKMIQAADNDQPLSSAVASAKLLKKVLSDDAKPVLTFATVHSFSSHTLLLRQWLAAGGVSVDVEVRIIVLPPEQMVDSLAEGVIDGFCVGEPWNSLAVEYGTGVIAATGVHICDGAPEKVLGVLEDWHNRNPATHLRLRLALMLACEWLGDMSNREATIEMLSHPEYLGLPVSRLRPSLSGQILYDRAQQPQHQSNFHIFASDYAGLPRSSQAELIIKQCSPLLGKPVDQKRLNLLAEQCFRADLYREAAALASMDCPVDD